MQVSFAHNFEYKHGLWVHKFLNTYTPTDTYLFTPFVTDPENNKLKILNSFSFKKYHYKLKRRENLTSKDHEFNTKIDYGY